MITEQASKIAVNIGSILTEERVSLVPKNGTLLQELSMALLSTMPNHMHTDKEELPNLLAVCSKGQTTSVNSMSEYQPTKHDTLSDSYISDLAKLSSDYLSYARATVNKEVTMLSESIRESIDVFKHPQPEDMFEVSYHKLNEAYVSGSLGAIVRSASDFSSRELYLTPIRTTIVNSDDFDPIDYLKTGDEDLDKEVVELINRLGKSRCINLINTSVIDRDIFSLFERLDCATFLTMFYRVALEKTDLPIGRGLIDTRNTCKGNADFFLKEANVSLTAIERNIKTKMVFTEGFTGNLSLFSDSKVKIGIYEDTFSELVEAGYDIQCLFGYIGMVDSSPNVVISELPTAESCAAAWIRSRTLYTLKLNRNKESSIKRILRVEFEKALKASTNEEEKAINVSDSKFGQETVILAEAYIESLELSDILDIDDICLDLVAKIRFRFSNAYTLLKEMSEIMKMDERIEPSEAALYSIVKYLTDFLLEQCDVVR